jgi:hypothetical protein
MPKSFPKNVRLSAGVVGKTVFLFCCANLRPAGEGLWLAGSPNSAGRGIGKGAISPTWGTARLGIGRTFSGSAIAAAGAGRIDSIDSKVDLSGKLCASETGAEPEDDRGSNSPP